MMAGKVKNNVAVIGLLVGICFVLISVIGISLKFIRNQTSTTYAGEGKAINAVNHYPVNTPVTEIPKKTKEPSATPTATADPIPEPTPQTTVQIVSVKRWIVSLTSDEWIDTGIPVIAGDTVNINVSGNMMKTDNHTLIKLGGHIYFNRDGRQIYFHEERGITPKFKDTIKLKLDQSGNDVTLEIAFNDYPERCLDKEGHQSIHETSLAWKNNLIQKMLKKI